MEVAGLVHVCINVTEQRCGQISPRIDETLERWGKFGALTNGDFFVLWTVQLLWDVMLCKDVYWSMCLHMSYMYIGMSLCIYIYICMMHHVKYRLLTCNIWITQLPLTNISMYTAIHLNFFCIKKRRFHQSHSLVLFGLRGCGAVSPSFFGHRKPTKTCRKNRIESCNLKQKYSCYIQKSNHCRVFFY